MTFTPKINQRSATLAVMKKERCGDSSLNPTQYTN